LSRRYRHGSPDWRKGAGFVKQESGGTTRGCVIKAMESTVDDKEQGWNLERRFPRLAGCPVSISVDLFKGMDELE